MTVQELIDRLKDYPRSATVVVGSSEADYVFDETYDVFEKRAVRHYDRDPSKFITASYGDTVVVIA